MEDTGIGMDPEEVPELFEPFSQASTGMGRSYEGSGLALTRKVVRRMDGTIDVETTPGEGTCFTVWLPKAGRTSGQVRPSWLRQEVTRTHNEMQRREASRVVR